jgi:hypothetical protein
MANGDVELRAELEDGKIFTQKVPIEIKEQKETPTDLPGTTARMAAAYEISQIDDPKQIAALGVKYQLMSRYTNYLAIDVKEDSKKAEDLPVLRKTPQMLAAGWGGIGMVMESRQFSMDYMQPVENLDDVVDFETPDYRLEEISNYIKRFSKRKAEEYPEFLNYLNKTRNKEQMTFFDNLFQIESNLSDLFSEDMTEQEIKDRLERLSKRIRKDIKDYLKFISSLIYEEVHKHEDYMERFVNEELERLTRMVKNIHDRNEQLQLFNREKFFSKLSRYLGTSENLNTLPTLKQLEAFGLPEEIYISLSKLVNRANTEEDVVAAVLYAFLMEPFRDILHRQAKRIIRKSYKKSHQNEDLYRKIKSKIHNL